MGGCIVLYCIGGQANGGCFLERSKRISHNLNISFFACLVCSLWNWDEESMRNSQEKVCFEEKRSFESVEENMYAVDLRMKCGFQCPRGFESGKSSIMKHTVELDLDISHDLDITHVN